MKGMQLIWGLSTIIVPVSFLCAASDTTLPPGGPDMQGQFEQLRHMYNYRLASMEVRIQSLENKYEALEAENRKLRSQLAELRSAWQEKHQTRAVAEAPAEEERTKTESEKPCTEPQKAEEETPSLAADTEVSSNETAEPAESQSSQEPFEATGTPCEPGIPPYYETYEPYGLSTEAEVTETESEASPEPQYGKAYEYPGMPGYKGQYQDPYYESPYEPYTYPQGQEDESLAAEQSTGEEKVLTGEEFPEKPEKTEAEKSIPETEAQPAAIEPETAGEEEVEDTGQVSAETPAEGETNPPDPYEKPQVPSWYEKYTPYPEWVPEEQEPIVSVSAESKETDQPEPGQ